MLLYTGLRRAVAVVWVAGLLFAPTLSLFPAVSHGEEPADLCRFDSLPVDVRHSLERRFGGWQIQSAASLSPRARQRWAAERPLTCPGIAVGHFDDSQAFSYALLLIGTDHASSRLLVFTPLSGQAFYGFRLVDQFESSADDVFVRTVPNSQYLGKDALFAHRSREGDSLLLSNSAKGTPEEVVYVWMPDGYRHQAVSP